MGEEQKPLTTAHELFLKRVREEMLEQGLVRKKDGKPSVNALAQRVGAPPQTTLNDIMNGADPRLESIHQIATALGKQVWQLFKERDARAVTNSTNIKNFPQPEKMIKNGGKSAMKKPRDRSKPRG